MGRAEPIDALPPPTAATTGAGTAAGAAAPAGAAERVTGLPLVLSRGCHELRGFALGAAAPGCVPTGQLWLVVSCPGLSPGVAPLVVEPAGPASHQG